MRVNIIDNIKPSCTVNSLSYLLICVLDTKSQNIPEVVVVGRGAGGFWEFERGGSTGRRGANGVSLQAT